MKVITRKWILTRAFLVFFLLLTPLLEILIVRVDDRYSLGSTVSEVTSKLSYIGKKTFSTQGQVDILFAGPSSVWVGVDARAIQEILRYLTRNPEIVVENFAHPKVGYEADYFILRDLVARRKVKAIILGVENRGQKKVHRMARFTWNPIKDPADFEISSTLYAEKFLDSFSTIIRSFAGEKNEIPHSYESTNGASVRASGFSEGNIRKKFVNKELPPSSVNLEALLLRPEDTLETGKYTPYQEYYLRKIIALAQEENILLYLMHIPSIQPFPLTKVPVFTFREQPEVTVPVLGIPVSRMFNATSWEETQDFFFNEEHLNKNGASGFSRLLLPAMKEIYEKTSR